MIQWAVLNEAGEIIDQFESETAVWEATYTGEYPDNAEVAALSDSTTDD